MADEKIYTVNLTPAWNAAYKKRAKKAIYVIKEYMKRHKSAKVAKVALNLNEVIWARGAKNPPRSVKIQIIKEKDDIFWAELAGVKFELPKKPEAKKEEKPKEEPVKEEKKEETTKTEQKAEEKPKEAPAKKEEKAPVKEEKPVKKTEEKPEKPVKAEDKETKPPVKKAEAKPSKVKPEVKEPVKKDSDKK